MLWINRNRARKLVIVVGIALLGLQASAQAATKVAVIERNGGGGLDWCVLLTTNGYECTVFPATGPTSSLDPFDIIVDLSNVWSDPDDLLADQMRAGKGVVTWYDAPFALQIQFRPTVQAWIGATSMGGGMQKLLTVTMDPILGSRPVGTELVDCQDSSCAALSGIEGHPGAKVLARFDNTKNVGLLRNFWEEGGQSVYLTDYLVPGDVNDDILLNVFVVLSNPIPTTSIWGLLLLAVVLLIGGVLILRQVESRARAHDEMLVSIGLLTALCVLGNQQRGNAQDLSESTLIVTVNETITDLSLGETPPFHTTQRQVINARAVNVTDSSIRLALWEEAEGSNMPIPFYAIALDGSNVDHVTNTSYKVQLRHSEFDPLVALPIIGASLSSSEQSNLFIVQFWTQPLPEFAMAIEVLGGSVVGYLPMHCQLARMSPAVEEQVRGLPFVRWVGSFHPNYRLEASLVSELTADSGTTFERVYTITVLANDLSSKNAVAQRVVELGGRVEFVDTAAPFVYATLSASQLQTIAHMDEVLFVGIRTEIGNDMDLARDLSGANHVEGLAGFSGEGVRGEVVDGNICAVSTDCGGSCTVHPDFVPSPTRHGVFYSDSCVHGTAVFGVVFGDGGDGGGDPTARGLLPEGIGFFASQGAFPAPPTSSRYLHTAELVNPALEFKCVFQTNSWGNWLGSTYDAESAEMDHIIFDLDLLICQAQSNYGAFSLIGSRPQAWAKNILSIGGVRHFNEPDHASHEWCESILNCSCDTCPACQSCLPTCEGSANCCTGSNSWCDARCPSGLNNYCASKGPAPGGRVKPDLVHFADRVWTTNFSTSLLYKDFLGTSAATPITCGYAGLVFQMWHESVFNVWNGTTSVPTGTPGGTVFSDRPHASTVKAMLINTAYRYPLETEPPLYRPDFTRDNMGWGIVDVAALYEQRNNMFIVNETDLVTNLATKSYTYAVPSGSPALRVTLVYSDPPGIPNSTVNLVNDLTLKVVSPSGTAYYGNFGLVECPLPGACIDEYFVGNWSVPTNSNGKDHKNNVENVFLKNPAAGNWTITVSADAIIPGQDGHVETPELDADFALVVSSGERPKGRCCQTSCTPSYHCECSWTSKTSCTGTGKVWSSEATCADDCGNTCPNTCIE